ncbi:MAG: efflux RND transporter periplasmic adaptor subunit, partial [Acidobacteriia bacterium]|nr:efflux RND transporter periplasmic adaptor subunit [Terriglobia bacterium]
LATRTMDTEVDIPNPSLVLIPGMFAEVDLTLSRHDGVVAAPILAVDRDSTETAQDAAAAGQVMVVTPNDRVEIRRVSLGIETSQNVEIRSGLNDGDIVVLSGRSGLKPGDQVRPKVTNLVAQK